MAEPTALDWLMTGERINPGAVDTDNLDDEIRSREEARGAADAMKWLYDGDDNTAAGNGNLPESVAPEREAGWLDMAGRFGKDVFRGSTEIVSQSLGGARDAVQEFNDLADSAGDWMNENVADLGAFQLLDKEGNLAPKYSAPGTLTAEQTGVTLPEVDPAASVTGDVVRKAAQFITGFVTGGKAIKGVKAVSGVAKAGKAMAQGAFSDFAAFDEHQARLSDLIETVPSLQNPVTDYLASDKADGVLEGRLKNAIEGAGLGLVAEGVLRGIRVVRAGQQAKVKSTAQHAKASQTILETDPLATLREAKEMNLLGDRAEPLFATARRKLETAAEETKTPVPDDVAAKGLTNKELAGVETFVNFARIEAPEDIHSVMGQMADAFKDDIAGATRGVQSNARTKALADGEDAWRVLIERRKGQPLNAEQSLAARQLWTTAAGKLQEVAMVAAKDPTPENLFQFRRMMALTHAIQKETIGARTETARALQQWAIPAGANKTKFKGIMDAIDQTGGIEVSAELAKRIAIASETGTPLQVILRMAEKGAGAKTLDAVHELWINGLLSGPKTHVVNAISNSSVVGLTMVERALAGRVSQFLGDEGVEMGEAMAMMHGLRHGWRDAFRNAGKAFRSGQSGYGVNKVEAPRVRAISSTAFNQNSDSWVGRGIDALGAAVNVPGRALQTGDEFFKTAGYRMSLHAQVHRQVQREIRAGKLENTADAVKSRMADLIETPPESLHLQAGADAAYQTFTSDPGPWTKSIMRMRGSVPGARWVLPFVNTPANILKYSFERTPLAPLTAAYRSAIAKGGADATLARTRMGLGSAIMLTAADWAMDDKITGSGPARGPERENWLRRGNKPYSIKIGNKFVAYNRFDPLGYIIGMSADMAEYAKNAEFDDDTWAEMESAAAATVFAAAENIQSKSYLQGFSSLAEAITEPDRFGAAYFEQLAGSFMPSIAAETARQLDPVQRVSYDMLTSLQRRTPGMSDDLPGRRDVWGREMTYQSGFGTTYDILSPMYGSTAKPEPIDEEMAKSGYFVGMPQKGVTVDGDFIGYKNAPEIYSRFLELQGSTKPLDMNTVAAEKLESRYGNRTLLETLNDTVTGKDEVLSSKYQELTDSDDKEAFIKKIVKHYRDAAKSQLFEEFPDIIGKADRIKKRRLERLEAE